VTRGSLDVPGRTHFPSAEAVRPDTPVSETPWRKRTFEAIWRHPPASRDLLKTRSPYVGLALLSQSLQRPSRIPCPLLGLGVAFQGQDDRPRPAEPGAVSRSEIFGPAA
jgi:hypothetical protein